MKPESTESKIMALLLAGDIGGTKTILRLVQAESTEAPAFLKTLYEMRYPSQEFDHLVPMVRQFLAEVAERLGDLPVPEAACFAIAGPVVNGTFSKVTNLGWTLETTALQEMLFIPQIRLINDFAAVGYGILGLEATDLHTLQTGNAEAFAPIGVIGAGTGLGQGYLVHQPGGYQVCSSEGGHADFAPRSELEFQLMRYLLEKHNIERISVERVVSGQGIVSIYQFLRDRQFAPESPEVSEVVQQWEGEIGRSGKNADPAAAIATAAMEKRDRLSEQTMQLFIEAYGAEAGNLALKLLPNGGMYIAGGIAAKILPILKEYGFIQAFNNKGRMRHLLQQIPIHVILNPQVGLIGAALCALRI
jgi:glucokinase